MGPDVLNGRPQCEILIQSAVYDGSGCLCATKKVGVPGIEPGTPHAQGKDPIHYTIDTTLYRLSKTALIPISTTASHV